MNWFNTILLLAAAYLVVFWEAAFHGVHRLLGAQIDLLPALMVYASLHAGLTTVSALAVCGGFWFDSLSANPLGISVLPLFAIGLVIYSIRELLVRDQVMAQSILGFVASAAAPLLVLVLLLSQGRGPLFGWGTVWQWLVMSVGGAIATPLIFVFFELLKRALLHGRALETSFRADREIRRGRS
jgi:hypothetical protein